MSKIYFSLIFGRKAYLEMQSRFGPTFCYQPAKRQELAEKQMLPYWRGFVQCFAKRRFSLSAWSWLVVLKIANSLQRQASDYWRSVCCIGWAQLALDDGTGKDETASAPVMPAIAKRYSGKPSMIRALHATHRTDNGYDHRAGTEIITSICTRKSGVACIVLLSRDQRLPDTW